MVIVKGKKMRKDTFIQESFEEIEKELEFLDLKPYSGQIISCRLRMVADKCGNEEANKLIDELGLELLGWKKVKGK